MSWSGSLTDLLPDYLPAQRWFSGTEKPSGGVRVERLHELWSEGHRRLWQAIVAAGEDHYQLLLGERPSGEPAEFLNGHDEAVLSTGGTSYIYDATLDSEMALALLEVASDGTQTASRARPTGAEQSNTSLVYDDRLILKVFRRLHPGRNPDVEITTALAAAGFRNVPAPLVQWRDEPFDLAFGQEFLAGGSDGWALALTSLRDLYNSAASAAIAAGTLGPGEVGAPSAPADAGGDFAAEAERLGRVTAEMHVALQKVLGEAPVAERATVLDELRSRLERSAELAGVEAAAPLIAVLSTLSDPGPVFRVHGDFHLGQVMRTDAGWFVLDFEGEPAKPLAERTRPESPLKDVAGMLRSFHYASLHALAQRPLKEQTDLKPLARAWETHNRRAFLDGYQSDPDIHALLPEPASAATSMAAYELDKVLYELEYERAHRPEWLSIPADGLERILTGGGDEERA